MTDLAHPLLPTDPGHRSLEDVHHTIAIPQGSWARRLFAFAGPAYMVSVGYMDPGNWATDIAGGSRFGYRLIWVLVVSNLMAILLQTLSARLGIVTGRGLAQACRDAYGPVVRWTLFLFCEIAIAACDLAEVLGAAIGIHLLFPHIQLMWAVLITGLDVFLLLVILRFGMRKMEAFILVLVSTIGVCFLLELFLSRPSLGGIAGGFVPRPMGHDELYVAIGIIGATVMPHNLYLHSALVQSRAVSRSQKGVAEACRFNLIDSVIALNVAFFVNAAILVVAAAAFGSRGIHVEGVQDAHRLLSNILGRFAPGAFALALLCAGLSSTITGTLAGQITMEGFLHFRMRPWLRRLITRALAIIPAVLVIKSTGEPGMENLLVLSQVILSLQLPFAVIPLVKFTSSRRQMGDFATPARYAALAWVVAVIILGLNGQYLVQQVIDWKQAAGARGHLVLAAAIPVSALLAALLAWLTFKPERRVAARGLDMAQIVLDKAAGQARTVRRIGVALEAVNADAAMLADAIALAKSNDAELVLMHVVEGAGGHWYGSTTGDAESRHDAEYLLELATRLRAQGVGSVRAVLGYGSVAQQIIALAKRESIDLLILGGHGHRGLSDVFRGTTIDAVRHGLAIPILAVRGEKK